jgi:hypothetical protein
VTERPLPARTRRPRPSRRSASASGPSWSASEWPASRVPRGGSQLRRGAVGRRPPGLTAGVAGGPGGQEQPRRPPAPRPGPSPGRRQAPVHGRPLPDRRTPLHPPRPRPARGPAPPGRLHQRLGGASGGGSTWRSCNPWTWWSVAAWPSTARAPDVGCWTKRTNLHRARLKDVETRAATSRRKESTSPGSTPFMAE